MVTPKQAALAIISLIVVATIAFVAFSLFSNRQKQPIITDQIYTNSVFNYSLTLPKDFEVRKNKDIPTDTRIKSDFSCLAKKTESKCFLFIDVYEQLGTNQTPPTLQQNVIAGYPGIKWLVDGNQNFRLSKNDLVFHIYYSSESAQLAKPIIDTLKL